MQVEYPAKTAPTIEILGHMFGNEVGDVVKVRMITDGEIYYYDGFDRWCFLYKRDEGKDWKWKKAPK